jgi:hypothetical protein
MKTQVSLDRDALYEFCDLLPAPIIAMPVLTATRGRGFTLSLECADKSVILIEDGKPCNFSSIDAIMFELDGAPNVDTSRLVINAGRYWSN